MGHPQRGGPLPIAMLTLPTDRTVVNRDCMTGEVRPSPTGNSPHRCENGSPSSGSRNPSVQLVCLRP